MIAYWLRFPSAQRGSWIPEIRVSVSWPPCHRESPTASLVQRPPVGSARPRASPGAGANRHALKGALFSSRTDGGFTVPAQVPTPSARGRSERGWHRGHQPAWPRPDVHFPGDSVHRCHRLPEHRCKEAQGWARARGTPLSPGLPSPCAD